MPTFPRALVLTLAACTLHAGSFSGRVVAVSDGDTIGVMHGGRAEQVRLWGIDCPEKGQPFGARARQFTGDLAFGKDVMVIVRGVDRYSRTVGEVILPDGRNLNRELVRAGSAWWYRPYARRDRELMRLETDARTARRGLWADAHPVPPWEWRKLWAFSGACFGLPEGIGSSRRRVCIPRNWHGTNVGPQWVGIPSLACSAADGRT